MSSWLSVSARDPRRDSSVNAIRYSHTVHEVVGYIGDATERAFSGQAWLKRGFPPKSYLRIEVQVHEESNVFIEKPRAKNYDGPREISSRVNIPADWFSCPGDGVLAMRLFRITLLVLRSIGDHYQIGLPPLRSNKTDLGRPELIDPFSPRPQLNPSDAADLSQLEELIARAEPDHLVAVVRRGVTRSMEAMQEGMVRALGTVEDDRVLSVAEGEGVRVWKVRKSG